MKILTGNNKVLLLLTLSFVQTSLQEEPPADPKPFQHDEDECPRFSVQEFYATVFEPMFESRLSFLEFALEKVMKEMEDVLVGMEERKKGEQDVEGVKTGIERLKQNALLSLHKTTFSVQESWSVILNLDLTKPKSEGGGTLTDLLDMFQNVLDVLKGNEDELAESFSEITEAGQHVINTMIKVLTDTIKKNEDQESAKTKMVDSLNSRGKILGMAMGRLVVAKLEGTNIPKYSFLEDLTSLAEKLNKEFYFMARKVSQPDFWHRFITSHRNSDRDGQGSPPTDAEIVPILSSLFFNSENDAMLV